AYSEEVKEYIDLYGVRKRALTERVMGLAQLYFPMFEQVLDQEGLPLEFKYLAVVESALNPNAVSPVGATGLWQFMLATGKMYGLKVDSYKDDRRDPVPATHAACQYFKDMYAIYGDWLLVIASYNCGAGNVNRAIARSGGRRTFWEISPYLPRETRGYVPAFIAVTYLMNYTAEHNLTAVAPLVNWFEVDTVQVNTRMDLRTVSAAVNVPYEVLSYLNPVYKKGIIPASEQPQTLRLPISRMNTYLAAESRLLQPVIEAEEVAAVADAQESSFYTELVRKIHRVRRGEHLSVIANKYRCTVSDIKKWNHLRSTRLSAGQSLKVYVAVPRKAQPKPMVQQSKPVDSSSTASASTPGPADSVSTPVSAPVAVQSNVAPEFVYHVVAPGDTLWKIARRYDGLTVEKIKEINQLDGNDLRVGTRLKVAVGG
ncbi:MAG: LysM peptidoglycan-binding domain-containing protein, partial [Flavobacteriales bacterium]